MECWDSHAKPRGLPLVAESGRPARALRGQISSLASAVKLPGYILCRRSMCGLAFWRGVSGSMTLPVADAPDRFWTLERGHKALEGEEGAQSISPSRSFDTAFWFQGHIVRQQNRCGSDFNALEHTGRGGNGHLSDPRERKPGTRLPSRRRLVDDHNGRMRGAAGCASSPMLCDGSTMYIPNIVPGDGVQTTEQCQHQLKMRNSMCPVG